jgi:hypothetical protein
MGAYSSLAALGLNAVLSQRAQRAEAKDLRKEQQRQIREIQLRDAEERRQQEQTLQRRVAEERARAGAAGVGSTGGAADAIVRGLAEESRLTSAARNERTSLRLDELRDTYDQRRRQSLLDFASRWLSSGRSSGRGRSLLG